MLISASHSLWADLIREPWMDQPLLRADNIQQRKSVQLTPCGTAALQLTPKTPFPSGAWKLQPSAPSLEKGQLWLLYWPGSSPRSEQGKPLLAAQQEPPCAAFSSRGTNILSSDPFPCSEVRSSDWGNTTWDWSSLSHCTGSRDLKHHQERTAWSRNCSGFIYSCFPNVLSHRAKDCSWCKGTWWKCQSRVEAEESCFLKKRLMASMLEVFFRSQLDTPAGVFLISQTKHNWKGVHREPCCYWSLWCTPDCSKFRLVQNQAQRFFYPHTSAKPSRQREPFTGVAIHNSVLIPFWQLQALYRCVQAVSGTSAKSLLGPG